MKISVNETTARALIERLADEQPGSDLQHVKRQLESGLQGTRSLTAAELERVVMSLVIQENELGRVGNPGKDIASWLQLLGTAIPKMQTMLNTQREREAQ